MLRNLALAREADAEPRKYAWNWGDQWARAAVLRALSKLRVGRLTLREGSFQQQFGYAPREEQSSGAPVGLAEHDSDLPNSLHATINVHDPTFYRMIAFGGSLGAGEAYMRGLWTCDDLTACIRLMIANDTAIQELNSFWSRLAAPARAIMHRLRRNTRTGSRRNIAAHYDLSNDFYRLMLDDTMTYSCGMFEHDGATMREASVAKLERICRRLRLSPKDHVLEIGTGWGGFAIHAARNYGCRVTTTTISAAQYEWAARRIQEEGLTGRITLLQSDYRDLVGQFDKLVSIEMIEAVGYEYFDTFFDKCCKLLAPDGAMFLQAITIAERHYESARNQVDFIKRYIFPGSCLTSVESLMRSVARVSDLQLIHLADITPHYARTLRCWREALFGHIDEVKALGLPDSFIRMWDFYLSYCEAGFLERTIGDVQMLLARPQCREIWTLRETSRA